jgi:hypothetical protein
MTAPAKADVSGATKDVLGAFSEATPTCWPRVWRCGPNGSARRPG